MSIEFEVAESEDLPNSIIHNFARVLVIFDFCEE